MEMHPPQQHFRINLAELKAHLIRKLGPDLSKQYFYYLNRFLSLKMSKVEFNKICSRIIGRENILLHNQFIRSILKNACGSKHPPPSHANDDVNTITTFGSKEKPTDLLLNGPVSMYNRDQIEGLITQEGKDLHARTQLRAPIGLPFCPGDVGLAHKASTLPSKSKCVGASNSGMLLDTVTLQERVEQIASSQGLEGLSTDCVSILNKGLDVYLKGLISSCVKLVGARSGQELIKKNNKLMAPSKLINGFRHGHVLSIQNINQLMEVTPEHRSNTVVALQDFRVAMELNPQQLGENWPLLLEKICSRFYDE